MAERAHPEDPGFQEGSLYRANLFRRYAFANKFTEDKIVLDIPRGVGRRYLIINKRVLPKTKYFKIGYS